MYNLSKADQYTVTIKSSTKLTAHPWDPATPVLNILAVTGVDSKILR